MAHTNTTVQSEVKRIKIDNFYRLTREQIRKNFGSNVVGAYYDRRGSYEHFHLYLAILKGKKIVYKCVRFIKLDILRHVTNGVKYAYNSKELTRLIDEFVLTDNNLEDKRLIINGTDYYNIRISERAVYGFNAVIFEDDKLTEAIAEVRKHITDELWVTLKNKAYQVVLNECVKQGKEIQTYHLSHIDSVRKNAYGLYTIPANVVACYQWLKVLASNKATM